MGIGVLMELNFKWKQRLRKAVRFSKAVGTVWESWEKMRDGGPITWTVGGVVMAGRMAEMFMIHDSVHLYLREQGYTLVEAQMADKVCKLLLSSDLPRSIRSYGEERHVLHEFYTEGVVILVWPHGDHQELHTKTSVQLGDVISPMVWDGKDLAAYFHEEGGWHSPTHTVFDLAPMGSVKPYVGDPSVEEVYARLGRSSSRMTTALIVGSTGSGKTTLARRVAEQARLGKAPICEPGLLKVPAHALQKAGSKEIVEAVRLIKPSALLIDDIPLDDEVNHKLLDLFEALDSSGLIPLVMGTLMVDDVTIEEMQKPGKLYWPGMRPGRIDEIILMPLPDAAKRAKVLSLYLGKAGLPQTHLEAFVDATEGLSGAYLARFVDRLQLHGMGSWEHEVERLRWQAPTPKGEDASEDLGEVPS